jgi:hypothetical protein
MSNEKPVRITVGDVKEVSEATAIQTENPVVRPLSAVSYAASVPDSSGNVMVFGAGLIGFAMLFFAGYMGLSHGIVPETLPRPPGLLKPRAMSDNSNANLISGANNAPAGSNATPDANNAPAANNSPVAANNAPVADNAPASNASAADNSPATNAPAANNTPK